MLLALLRLVEKVVFVVRWGHTRQEAVLEALKQIRHPVLIANGDADVMVPTSNSIALFDAPWIPIYVLVCFMVHPLIGWLTVGGAAILIEAARFGGSTHRMRSRHHQRRDVPGHAMTAHELRRLLEIRQAAVRARTDENDVDLG